MLECLKKPKHSEFKSNLQFNLQYFNELQAVQHGFLV